MRAHHAEEEENIFPDVQIRRQPGVEQIARARNLAANERE
jgi:hypothetical protein